MKSKNVYLLIALMLVTSIFFSSCIIVHDWDDDYVYTAKSNLDDYEHCYGTITETGFNFSYTDTKYKFDDVDRRIVTVKKSPLAQIFPRSNLDIPGQEL